MYTTWKLENHNNRLIAFILMVYLNLNLNLNHWYLKITKDNKTRLMNERHIGRIEDILVTR